MQFEIGPFEGRETEVDDGGVKRVDRVFEIKGKIIIMYVQFSGLSNEILCKILPDSPVSVLISSGECGESKLLCFKAKVIELIGVGIETKDYSTQTVEIG